MTGGIFAAVFRLRNQRVWTAWFQAEFGPMAVVEQLRSEEGAHSSDTSEVLSDSSAKKSWNLVLSKGTLGVPPGTRIHISRSVEEGSARHALRVDLLRLMAHLQKGSQKRVGDRKSVV